MIKAKSRTDIGNLHLNRNVEVEIAEGHHKLHVTWFGGTRLWLNINFRCFRRFLEKHWPKEK
jgi:hypothetical protein